MTDKSRAQTLPPATADEVEWIVRRALKTARGDDSVRRGIVSAPTEDDAVYFVRDRNPLGSCGPSGAPGDGPYWIDFEREAIHAWFGDTEPHRQGEDFQPGSRYVKIAWSKLVRRVRAESKAPALF